MIGRVTTVFHWSVSPTLLACISLITLTSAMRLVSFQSVLLLLLSRRLAFFSHMGLVLNPRPWAYPRVRREKHDLEKSRGQLQPR